MNQKRDGYQPSQERIRRMCRKIQSEWTPEEEMERRVIKNHQPDYGRVVRTGSE